MTCAELVLPTDTVPKESVVGDIVTGKIPFPVTSNTCVLTNPLSITVIPPTDVPVAWGVNVIVIVQVLPALKVPLHGVVPLRAPRSIRCS